MHLLLWMSIDSGNTKFFGKQYIGKGANESKTELIDDENYLMNFRDKSSELQFKCINTLTLNPLAQYKQMTSH